MGRGFSIFVGGSTATSGFFLARGRFGGRWLPPTNDSLTELILASSSVILAWTSSLSWASAFKVR